MGGRVMRSTADDAPKLAATRTTQVTVQTKKTNARNLTPRMNGLRSFTRLQRGQMIVRFANSSVHWRHLMKFCRRRAAAHRRSAVCEVVTAMWGMASKVSDREIS